MTVNDVLKITEIGEMQEIVLYSMDGMTDYGCQNSVYKIDEKYLNCEAKKMKLGYGSLTIFIEEV